VEYVPDQLAVGSSRKAGKIAGHEELLVSTCQPHFRVSRANGIGWVPDSLVEWRGTHFPKASGFVQ